MLELALNELAREPRHKDSAHMWGIRVSHWHRSVLRIQLGRAQDYRLIYWILEEDFRRFSSLHQSRRI